MKHIVLICSAGMSTSLLVNKMRASAEEEGKDVEIQAMSSVAFESYSGDTDVLLLGPQIRFMFDRMKNTYEKKGIQVAVIDMMDYGMMNGKKVLEEAYRMMGE